MSDAPTFPNPRPAYRLDLLPVVPPYYRRARQSRPAAGELVYYGPAPAFYGVGEVVEAVGRLVRIDFRGTGQLGVHEETLQTQYVLPIPEDRVGML